MVDQQHMQPTTVHAVVKCGARNRRCRNCKHKFTKAEHDLWNCPACGEDRHCVSDPVEGSTRCRMHGGKSPKGVASATFIHGGRSKALKGKLGSLFSESRDNPDLLSLRDDVATVDASINAALEQLGEGTGFGLWKAANDQYALAKIFATNKDQPAFWTEFNELGRLLRQGRQDERTWNQVYNAMNAKRRLVATEMKHELARENTATAEDFMAVVLAMMDVVREVVTDLSLQRRIGDRLMNMLEASNDDVVQGQLVEEDE